MTKGELISLIRQRKSGGLADRISGIKYGKRVIAKYIDIARKEILIANIIESPITDNFLKTFYPYVWWSDLGGAYFNLPASTVHLVDENGDYQGLQWVSGKNENVDGWIIGRNMESSYMNYLEGGQHGRPNCYIEGTKVWLPNMLKQNVTIGDLCVKVRIIPDTNGYTDDEDFPLPIKESSFLDLCCKMMDELKLTSAKTGNDGNPNPQLI